MYAIYLNPLGLSLRFVVFFFAFALSSCGDETVRTQPGPGLSSGVEEFQPAIVFGGRATVIARQPGSSTTFLAGAATGGIWRTTDAGNSWAPISDFPHHRITDIEFLNEDVVIATASMDFRRTSSPSIWRSTDGGLTWTQPPTVGPGLSNCPSNPGANSITFDEESGTVLVGTDCSLAISENLGESWGYRNFDLNMGFNRDTTQNRIYAVQFGRNGRAYMASTGGIRYSTDRGQNWTLAASVPVPDSGGLNVHSRASHAFAISPFDDLHAFMVARDNRILETKDGGVTWNYLNSPTTQNRPGFLRITAGKTEAITNRQSFDLYYGNGVTLHRMGFRITGSTVDRDQSWSSILLSHADPSDICFGADGNTPVFVATDGGIHRQLGSAWVSSAPGYNALQITQVEGQIITSQNPHLDLYFATQDNSIWASSDAGQSWPKQYCCEGFHLDVDREVAEHGDAGFTGTSCGPCHQFLSNPHLGTVRRFENPSETDGHPVTWAMAPQQVLNQGFLQWTRDDESNPTLYHFWSSTDNAASWNMRYRRNTAIHGPTIWAGNGFTPVLYQPYITGDWIGGIGRRSGLLRIENPWTDALKLQLVHTGLNLGTLPLEFNWDPVIGVRPDDGAMLIAPDLVDNMMKISRDSGRTWGADTALTRLVTDNGNFFFRRRRFSLVSKIAWDEEALCQILIGTRQNGIIRSRNGGRTWEKMPGTDRIPEITDFFFLRDENAVLVSSYGRGLWKVDLGTRPTSCEPPRSWLAENPQPLAMAIWLGNGKDFEVRDFNLFGTCEGCTWLINRFGEISDIGLTEKSRVQWVNTTGGLTAFMDQEGKSTSPSFKLGQSMVAYSEPGSLLSTLRKRGPIRALILRDDALIAIVVAMAELDFWRVESPQLNIGALEGGMGDAVSSNARLRIQGSGFNPFGGGSGSITLEIAELGIRRTLQPTADGKFRLDLQLNSAPGIYTVEARRTTSSGMVAGRDLLRIVPIDSE